MPVDANLQIFVFVFPHDEIDIPHAQIIIYFCTAQMTVESLNVLCRVLSSGPDVFLRLVIVAELITLYSYIYLA